MAITKYSYKKDKNTKLSENFKVSEFVCANGSDEIKIDSRLVEYLQNIRTHFGKPVKITSAYRPEPYNSSIGGTYGSYHTLGRACDFYISGISVEEIAKYAEEIGVLGIGCYKDDLFVHIDTRPTKFYWYNQSYIETYSFGGKIETEQEKKVKIIQNWLNRHFKSGLNIDGQYGELTKSAIIKAGQYMCLIEQTGEISKELTEKYPQLRDGSVSAYVALVQASLICKKFECLFDGKFGNNTLSAVKAFQAENKLEADGICGEKTLTELFS